MPQLIRAAEAASRPRWSRPCACVSPSVRRVMKQWSRGSREGTPMGSEGIGAKGLGALRQTGPRPGQRWGRRRREWRGPQLGAVAAETRPRGARAARLRVRADAAVVAPAAEAALRDGVCPLPRGRLPLRGRGARTPKVAMHAAQALGSASPFDSRPPPWGIVAARGVEPDGRLFGRCPLCRCRL